MSSPITLSSNDLEYLKTLGIDVKKILEKVGPTRKRNERGLQKNFVSCRQLPRQSRQHQRRPTNPPILRVRRINRPKFTQEFITHETHGKGVEESRRTQNEKLNDCILQVELEELSLCHGILKFDNSFLMQILHTLDFPMRLQNRIAKSKIEIHSEKPQVTLSLQLPPQEQKELEKCVTAMGYSWLPHQLMTRIGETQTPFRLRIIGLKDPSELPIVKGSAVPSPMSAPPVEKYKGRSEKLFS